MQAGREALFRLSSGWFYIKRSKNILNFRISERAKTQIKFKSMFQYGTPKSRTYGGYSLGRYLTEPCRGVRYGRNSLPNTPVRFGTNSTPVPYTSVSSVRPHYQYPTLRKVRYDLNTSTRHLGKFGTTSIPVPHTSVITVRPQYRYLTLR